MAGGMAEDARLVYLVSEVTGDYSRYLTARRVASGDLWIEGQVLGPESDTNYPLDGELEWVWVVAADKLPELLRVLGAAPDTDVLDELAEHWSSGTASGHELERLLREGGLGELTVI